MNFNLKIYTHIEYDIVYDHFLFFESLKLKVLKSEKRKRKSAYV
jgi:hypothetical protein